MAKSREEILKRQSEWYFKNKEKLKVRYEKYNKDNKDRIVTMKKEYAKNNREKLVKIVRDNRLKYRSSWKDVIPSELDCPICGRRIFFNSGDWKRSINFDHRHDGSEPIKGLPSAWLSRRTCNEENIKIWNSCDFGMLCVKCNRILPTKNRKEWFFKVKKYIFG